MNEKINTKSNFIDFTQLKNNLPAYVNGLHIYTQDKECLCSCNSNQNANMLCNIINSFFNNMAVFKNLIVSSIQLYETIANANIEVNTSEKALLYHAYLDFENQLKAFLKNNVNILDGKK